MPASNSDRAYGAVTKTFHWLTAALILTAIPLGLIASDIAHAVTDPSIETSSATPAGSLASGAKTTSGRVASNSSKSRSIRCTV